MSLGHILIISLALTHALGCTAKGKIPLLHLPDVAARYDKGWYAGSSLGEWTDARKEFAGIVAVAPEFAEAQHNLGVACAHLGEWDVSLEAFERAVHIDPSLALSAAGVTLASRARRGLKPSAEEIPRFCRKFRQLEQEGC